MKVTSRFGLRKIMIKMRKYTRTIKTITYAETYRQIDKCGHLFVMREDPKEIKKQLDIANKYIALLSKKCGETKRIKHYISMIDHWNFIFQYRYKARKV